MVLPLNLGMKIAADDSVLLLSGVVDAMDLGAIAIKPLRRSKIPAIIMLKIIVYGYMNGLYSSRQIETACRRDINFMWLLQRFPAPDHNTIARFRENLDSEKVFVAVVKELKKMNELEGKAVFVDGTKLEANANKYSFVWKGSTEKLNTKLNEKIDIFLLDINERYGVHFLSLEGVIDYLDITEFISGSGKRKSKRQKDYEVAMELLSRQRKYLDYLSKMDGRNSLSKTDNDATFMRLKEDSMKNGQLKPAYNVQIAVENEYITGTYISSDRNDTGTLIPMLNKLETSGTKYEEVVADAGYESEENYEFLKKKNYTSYVKPQNYEHSKTRKYKQEIGRKENMSYDSLADEFTCAAGNKLKKTYSTTRKSPNGYVSNVSHYECEACGNCEKKSLCTKARGNKKIEYAHDFTTLRNESLKNIISERGQILRLNRSIQVEGAFGVLKQDYSFRRFLTRGKKNISTEFNLLCIAYNLKKLHNNIIFDRMGSKLHKLQNE